MSLNGLAAGVSSNSCPHPQKTVFTDIPIHSVSLWGLLVVEEVFVCLANLGPLCEGKLLKKAVIGN